MKKIFAALLIGSLLASAPAMSFTGSGSISAPKSCRDAKGKFIKCPAAAPAKPKQCRDAKGKFIKC